MWTVDHELFDNLAKACGSRYLAVTFVADAARELALRTSTWLIDSKLITWVLTGEEPDVSKILENTYYLDHPDVKEMDEFLCYVEDQKIVESVRNSYFKSVKNRHLVYDYNRDLNDGEQARVRVLLRMIWYKLRCNEEE